MLELPVSFDSETFTVDLAAVDGLDALSFLAATGGHLDVVVARMIGLTQAEGFTAESWPLADRVVLRWLHYRHNGLPSVSLAEVAADCTLLPASAGSVVAPEAG